jgi:hypothetical protein
VEQQFINIIHREMMLCAEDADALLEKLEAYQAPQIDKVEWILRMTDQTR